MAGKISELNSSTVFTALDDGDLVEIVDLSDTSMAASGTNKPTTVGALRGPGQYYAGQYYGPTWYPALNNVYTTCALNGGFGGKFMLTPFEFRRPVTLDRIAVEVTTAGPAGCVLRFAIYADSATLTGTKALILDAGTAAADSTGVKSVTISQALTPGRYWIGAAGQVAASSGLVVRGGPSSGYRANAQTGASTAAMNGHEFGGLQVAATGAAPSPSGTLTVDIGQGPIGVMVRIA